MESRSRWWQIIVLLLVIFLGSLSNVCAQDLFREMDQLKGQLSDLKNEVRELKDLVYGLRKAVLKSFASQDQRPSPPAPAKEENVVKQENALDEKQLTGIICQTVGKFFSEAEAILKAGNASTAEARMRKAVWDLNSALQSYDRIHRVAKILKIYEGLAWDAYVAVELRQSVAGNVEFLEALKKHKQKYAETCPKD